MYFSLVDKYMRSGVMGRRQEWRRRLGSWGTHRALKSWRSWGGNHVSVMLLSCRSSHFSWLTREPDDSLVLVYRLFRVEVLAPMSALVCVPKARSSVESHSLCRSVTSWNSVFSLLERFAKSRSRFRIVISHSAFGLIVWCRDGSDASVRPSQKKVTEALRLDRNILTKFYTVYENLVPQLDQIQPSVLFRRCQQGTRYG